MRVANRTSSWVVACLMTAAITMGARAQPLPRRQPNQLEQAMRQMGRTTFTKLTMITHKLQELVNKEYVKLSDDEPVFECWQTMIGYAKKREFAKAAASCREAGEYIQKMSKSKGDLPDQIALLYLGVATELQFTRP